MLGEFVPGLVNFVNNKSPLAGVILFQMAIHGLYMGVPNYL